MQILHKVPRLVKQTIALAKRRPLLFFGAWAAKWVLFYLFLVLIKGSSNTAPSSTQPAPLAIDSNNDVVPVKQERPTEAVYVASFATIITDLGDIVLELLPDVAPKTVATFTALANRGFFNDTTLYRYESGFVLQGGGWPKKSSPLPTIPLEYHMPNYKYHVSTARTSDPNSATCEYSIMLNDNSKWLGPGGSDPYGYAVFARVHRGIDVIERFASLKTKKQGLTMLDPAVKVRAWVISSGVLPGLPLGGR
ncbi:cyclophilin type peptidyl-prolyl cis-trans isomerase, putative [Bodo saltans]|uniref:Peptidyl-prolyl cis-trans isomerase n=1 Tax=Bodo saltans TaxID=75058 RepID=A0A0S4JS68_BODSA|nr:cyclophilin type peptidyl-prolyl cis-trans isomerase, putative [Bodo saltans]|eukprot:CUG94331.1 cyclophilin type peptidyl-prolyl cis-trans isomerase, putative [Bodo saltans]